MGRIIAFDIKLLVITIILVSIGIIAVYTASYPSAMAEGNPFDTARTQFIYAIIGIIFMCSAMYIPLNWLRKLAFFLGFVGLALLVAVFFWGIVVNGNKNWLEIIGIRFQPSEIMKGFLILVIAEYFASYAPRFTQVKKVVIAYLIIFIPIGIIVLQRDLGTIFILILSCSAIFAITGMKIRYWGTILLVLLGMGFLMVSLSDRGSRIDAWRHPFKQISASYQPRNALIAIGSGGLLGRGFTKSLQKWHYLPAAHNDYIFAIIAEEMGLIWTFVVIFVPYGYLMYRGFDIAHSAPDKFSSILAASCTVILAVPAIVNMAVVTNMIPCMGINLPFISYGGTSVIVSLTIIGILLNVSRRRGQDIPAYRRVIATEE